MDTQSDLIQRLKRVAASSPNNYKHAAALINRNGDIIVAANNRYRSHAEERTVRRYLAVESFRRQKAAYLVVIRLSKGGHGLASSKPCLKCQRFLGPIGLPVIHS